MPTSALVPLHPRPTLDMLIDRLNDRARSHFRTMAEAQFDAYHDDYAHAREHGNHAAATTAKAGMDYWGSVINGSCRYE